MKISKMHKTNEEDRTTFDSDSSLSFLSPDTQVMLNVGGQIFQTTCGVLTKDRFSILAALCSTGNCPLEKDENDCFFLERDWWVFRYILQFLRNNTLPRDGPLLEEMYTEASFYRLNSLRRAIEARASSMGMDKRNSKGRRRGGGSVNPDYIE